jgi:hypothetical protein
MEAERVGFGMWTASAAIAMGPVVQRGMWAALPPLGRLVGCGSVSLICSALVRGEVTYFCCEIRLFP